MIKKHWFNILVYLSLVFLVVKLLSGNHIELPENSSHSQLLMSLFFLFLSFFLLSIRWKLVLKAMDINATVKESIISVGLPVFSKYIPGKVFMIIGKTGYLNKEKGLPVSLLSIAALTDQILAIITGLAMGSIVMLKTGSILTGIIPIILLWSGLVVFLFHPGAIRLLTKLIDKLLHRTINIQMPSSSLILKLLPIHLAYWLSISTGFFFLSSWINSGQFVSPFIALAFPFAVCAGMLVLIAPGGIGVRESVILAVCESIGLTGALPASIAITSRFWFTLGELTIFITALILKKMED